MNLEPQQIFQLVSLLAVLALFSISLRGQIGYARWFKKWEADRKARRRRARCGSPRTRRPAPERPLGLSRRSFTPVTRTCS